MEFEQSALDELMEFRKALAPVKAENKTALESIIEWISDGTGSIQLSEANEKIFNRYKEIYKLKLDGKTSNQIISYMSKFSGHHENTIRNDLKNIGKIFPHNLDVDVEMYVLYEKNQMLISRLTNSNNHKMLSLLPNLIRNQKEILLYFKGDNNLPDPNLFKPNVFIITSDPKDIGIDDPIPSMDELKRKYKSKSEVLDVDFEESQ